PRRVRRLGRGPGGSLRARGTLPKVAPRPIGGWSWAGPLLGRGFRVLLLGRSSRFGAGRGGLGRGTGGLGDLRVFGRGQEGLDAANDRLAQERVEAGEEVADVARASAGTDDGENAARRRLDESRVRGEAIPTVAFAGGGVGAATRPDDALLGGYALLLCHVRQFVREQPHARLALRPEAVGGDVHGGAEREG